jgi:hypothetical protein
MLAVLVFTSCTKSINKELAERGLLEKYSKIKLKTVHVGDGSSDLIITGSYPEGTLIVVKPGTYNKGGGIQLDQLSNVTVQLTGVILDGLNKTQAGYYNVLSLNNLTNVIVTGGSTINNGYRQLYINGKTEGLIITNHSFKNNSEGIFTSAGIEWTGTDATTAFKNCGIINCSFDNCGGSTIGGTVDASTNRVMDLVKNFEISGCTWNGGNPGTSFYFPAIDSARVYDNNFKNVNLNTTNDNRVFIFAGSAECYNNSITNYQGHFAALWAVSFGNTAKTSHFYKNNCNGSLKYSAFEFQEFARLNIPGKTTYGNLVVNQNKCSNLNTEHHTEFDANFIDNYEYGLMGGHVTLTNNIGSNFFPIPQPGIFWNLAKPSVVSGNTYL